jgi:hypothetical protein
VRIKSGPINGFVKGHDFSRAANVARIAGFSP